ncbi:MAG: patatin-like phospholipase family protein [Pseudomonadota bacterium]
MNHQAEKTGAARAGMPGQVVLVFQGGGALGAYQAGVYEAMHEAGIEPDWVIGTSIGAINGALVAGNRPEHRLERLQQFWERMQHHSRSAIGFSDKLVSLAIIAQGIPAFFKPNSLAWRGPDAVLALEQASYYSTEPLERTLRDLVDFDYLADGPTRLTVGAVNARSGQMRYFDSSVETLGAAHVMASGALPPAFPAVRIDGQPYWDGGIYSNTPIEAVLEDRPRRDSVIFSVQVWNPHGPELASLAQVIGKQKDIQFASRASHIESQRQLHRLRHVIRELAAQMPAKLRASPEVAELAAWGCGTTMHIVKLNAPMLDGEDHGKDADFSTRGIRERWLAGYCDTRSILARQPWNAAVDPIEGVLIHEP